MRAAAVCDVYELLFTLFTNCCFTNCCFTNCCLCTAVYELCLCCLRSAVYDLLFTICCLTNCCFTNCCLRTAVLRTAVYDLLFYELDFSTTVQLPQPTVTAMTVIPLTNNHCTFALLTNHYFNYHYQRLLIATPQLSSLLLHIKKPLQFWRCHE